MGHHYVSSKCHLFGDSYVVGIQKSYVLISGSVSYHVAIVGLRPLSRIAIPVNM
jgi:hypothetical protein